MAKNRSKTAILGSATLRDNSRNSYNYYYNSCQTPSATATTANMHISHNAQRLHTVSPSAATTTTPVKNSDFTSSAGIHNYATPTAHLLTTRHLLHTYDLPFYGTRLQRETAQNRQITTHHLLPMPRDIC